MLPPRARDFLLITLSGAPVVLERLLKSHTPTPSLWDTRPDPERFSLREVLAHLADWEPIARERLSRTCDEEHPFLPSRDPTRIAEENDYAHSDPLKQLARFRDSRERLVEYLSALPENAWQRTAHRELTGDMTLEEQVVLVAAHDGYHLKQIAEALGAVPQL